MGEVGVATISPDVVLLKAGRGTFTIRSNVREEQMFKLRTVRGSSLVMRPAHGSVQGYGTIVVSVHRDEAATKEKVMVVTKVVPKEESKGSVVMWDEVHTEHQFVIEVRGESFAETASTLVSVPVSPLPRNEGSTPDPWSQRTLVLSAGTQPHDVLSPSSFAAINFMEGQCITFGSAAECSAALLSSPHKSKLRPYNIRKDNAPNMSHALLDVHQRAADLCHWMETGGPIPLLNGCVSPTIAEETYTGSGVWPRWKIVLDGGAAYVLIAASRVLTDLTVTSCVSVEVLRHKVSVHGGMWSTAKEALPAVLEALAKIDVKKVVVTGHGRGGGYAVAMGMQLLESLKGRCVEMVTFGAPRVVAGDVAKLQEVVRKRCKLSCAYEMCDDPVPCALLYEGNQLHRDPRFRWSLASSLASSEGDAHAVAHLVQHLMLIPHTFHQLLPATYKKPHFTHATHHPKAHMMPAYRSYLAEIREATPQAPRVLLYVALGALLLTIACFFFVPVPTSTIASDTEGWLVVVPYCVPSVLSS